MQCLIFQNFETGLVQQKKDKFDYTSIRTRMTPKFLTEAASFYKENQRKLIVKMGFKTLLSLKTTKMEPQIGFFW